MKTFPSHIYKVHIKKQKGECKLKVAFWSNIHGQNGTTSNMLAAGIMSVLQFNSKVFICQSHYKLNNLEGPLLYLSKKEKNSYFMNVGIDAMIRSIKSKYLEVEIIENSTFSYMNKKLMLLPTTIKNNCKIYEEDLETTIVSILQAVEKYHDIVFVDVSSRDHHITKKILENVDYIVVNLCQNIQVLNDFEENFLSDLQNNNIIYILGNYDPDSRYSLANLRKNYSWLRPKSVGVIPYNTEFMDSMSDGKIIPFFHKNYNNDKNDANYYFINEVKKTTNLIHDSRIQRRW